MGSGVLGGADAIPNSSASPLIASRPVAVKGS